MTPIPAGAPDFPDNPVLCRVWRGDFVESQHRGAWCLVDTDGGRVAGSGDVSAPVLARSAIKSLQALPLVESGAAERFGFAPSELALACSSHNAEPCHTEGVAAVLARLELGVEQLQCGPQPPGDPAARAALARAGAAPTALHNNCSGKHAGFLALARHLDVAPERYLDPGGASQAAVLRAVAETCGVAPGDVGVAVDGCSAPTLRLPLAAQARGIARMASPDDLAPERAAACRALTAAVTAHPVLLAGSHRRFCTDLVRATGGRCFGKVGAEAVYLVGLVGTGRGLAVKVDDGGYRAMHAVVVELLARLGYLDADALAALAPWHGRRITNWAGREVGQLEVVA